MILPLDTAPLLLAAASAFVAGVSKSGVKGLGIFVVTLMAIAVGSKLSSGVVLVLFMLGDVFAVIYYKRYVVWSLLFQLLPAMIVGVLAAVWAGQYMDEDIFRKVMSVIILVSVCIMYWWEFGSKQHVPRSRWFGYGMGLAAGFTTMIGNLAGAFSNIFFLSLRIDKNEFIGTASYLFFIINLFKFPFHVFVWRTISWDSLYLNIILLPVLCVGLFVGIRLLSHISTATFRKMILILTALGAVALLLLR